MRQSQDLWNRLVPGSGPATTGQGEVVRIAGRLAREILVDGRMNGDADFAAMLTALVAARFRWGPWPTPADRDRRSGSGAGSALYAPRPALSSRVAASGGRGLAESMKNRSFTAVALATAAVAVGGVVAGRTRRAPGSQGVSADDAARWRVVTIDRPRGELPVDGPLPEPLALLGGSVEVRWTDAPGDHGTELAARCAGEPHEVRAALRESKQLLEVGWVMTNTPQPEGARPATPAGLLTDLLVRRSPGEGVL